VLLNLLIAIVPDEFDQFMERASLEAQLALAAMCKEAREVLAVRAQKAPALHDECLCSVWSHTACLHAQMGLATHPDFFPRHLFVLQAKSEEVRDTDEWAGKVKAVVKHVDVLRAAQDTKIDALQAAQDEINSKIDAVNKNMEKILEILTKE
jgi:hypothetical protein